MAHEAHNGLLGVVGVDPFEALLGIGVLPQSALLGVEVVECLDKALLSAVGGVEILGEEPLDGLVVAPFDLLADLVTHEGKLGAGVGHLVEGERAQTGETAPVVARHASNQGALAVHDLIVRQRQDKVLREGVHDGEGEQAVVARAPREVALHVVQGVVHPAHIPFEVESQAAVLCGIGDQGPCGGLLGDHHDIGEFLAHSAVDLADKRGGVEVLLGAVFVELLVRWVAHAEVEIEHARYAIHADAVDMELFDPEEGVGHEEAANLGAGEIELVRAPVGVNLAFEEHAAVEGRKSLGVGAKAPGNPVQNHSDAGLVAGVDEVHELLGGAVTRGCCEVSRSLISPRSVEGVLGEGHDLDMGIAHLLDVSHELIREVVVGVVRSALRRERIAGAGPGAVFAWLALRFVAMALPGAKVHLINVERALHDVALGAAIQPCGIFPGVSTEVPELGCCSRASLSVETERVGLPEELPRIGFDHVFVKRSLLKAGDEGLPYIAIGGTCERRCLGVPAVEIADDVHA